MIIDNYKFKEDAKKFKCPNCDLITTTVTGLSCHRRNSTGEVIYCDICNFKSCTKSLLSDHKKNVHGIGIKNEFSCDHCDYATNMEKLLLAHNNYRKSSDISLVPCDICFINLCSSDALHRHHKMKHSKKKKPKYEKKMRFSEKTKKFCKICKKEYKTPQLYQKHYRLLHGDGRKTHYCFWCSYSSRISTNVLKHASAIHNKIWSIRNTPTKPATLEKTYFVLPRPKKGTWIVQLNRIDGWAIKDLLSLLYFFRIQ